jgi:predicted permease
VDTIWQDIRFGIRTLAKKPGFTAVAALSLALGIGANTALFSLVNALLLRHLPVDHPEQLVALGLTSRVNGVSEGTPQLNVISQPLYRALSEKNHSFSGLLASGRVDQLDLRAEGVPSNSEPEHPRARLVSGNYFTVLGVRALIGRTFTDEDDKPGASPAVVLSYQYWQRRFGLDPSVLGKRLTINGGQFSVVGVAVPEFYGEVVGAQYDFWIPLIQQAVVNPGRNWINDPRTSFLLLMGRLKPGVTIEQARAELDPLAHQIIPTLPGLKMDNEEQDIVNKKHLPVQEGGVGFSSLRARFSQPLLLLFGMVAVVLLICCANIANLLLTRAAARAREVGVRLAMGAGRARLVRQLLTESFLLALLGTACGALFAVWATRLLLEFTSRGPNPIPLDVRVDIRVLGFTLAVSILTAILFGLAPALRAIRVDILAALKPSQGRTGNAAGPRQKFGVGKGLVVAQVAVSLLLLTGAGLLARSLRNLSQQDVGFERDRLLEVETDPVGSGYDEKQMNALISEVTTAVGELPGAQSVVTSYNGLFSGTENDTILGLGDLNRPNRDDREIFYDMVGPDYFQTIGGRMVRGRGITREDTESSPKVAVISSTAAKFFYPGADPIGHYLMMGDTGKELPVQIVGVVSDIKERDLSEEAGRRMFLPLRQRPDSIYYLRILVRTAGAPGAMKQTVRARLAERFPNLRVLDNSTVAELMREDVTEERMLAQLSIVFGGLALALAVTGLYGVMSYTTSLRTSEIGIRMALGADSANVLRMVLGESLVLLAVGLVVGGALAVAALRVLSNRLFGLSATDPATFAAATLVLALSVLLAGYLPARRASRVNPLVALHEE